ncbi:hypothetical protein ACFOLJ_28525 [Rugamonas sp. CCM 8940]|uniref:hypothetical protein n=1 Tax=Rugamonas sp. CCM 8940 TaxID=2765359 RepID=UPI0018F2938E|nr:hypothetical protein [Rugamonas sp. CCM 8940]MBJ7311640.1 hypothetical protein [Rugamonas sp. CCM 8940]
MRWRPLPLLCLLANGLAASASAADPLDGWLPLPDSALEQARGGFDLGNGLLVSLGVERLVSINGNVVASSNFSIADVTKLGGAEAVRAGEALAALTLVQNGPGNVFQPAGAERAAGALVIQNSVNDQLIRSQTTISATVNSLSLLKALQFEGGLRDALSNVVGPK